MTGDRNGMKKTDEIEQIKEDMCDNFCKWPEQWSETETIEIWSDSVIKQTMTRRMSLSESDICRNCPLNRL